MLKPIFFPLMACAAALLATSHPADAAEITARDLRMETRTQWDYQPGQGPRRRATDRDFFRPETKLPEQPLTPPPPVVSGDWKNPPRAEDLLPPKDLAKHPKTQTAMELGVQGSYYHYHERDVAVKIQGPQGGVHFIGTGEIGGQWFLRGDGRFTAGSHHYKGTGEMDTTPNYTGELRATIGRDFLTRSWGFSPYVGVGYRYLYNDLRGTTTTGAEGYRRHSHYLFAPIGIENRAMVPNGDVIALRAEFDPLLMGWQKSTLSDVDSTDPDLNNKQRGGFGVHASLMYQHEDFSFGPYMNYWNINRSDTDCATGSGGSLCGYEPHNHTLEYGMQFRYRFYKD